MSETTPSTLFVLWPWREPPTLEEVRHRVRRLGEFQEVGEQLSEGTDVLWASAWSIEGMAQPTRMWVFPLREERRLGLAELLGAALSEARWQVAVETRLDPDEPLESYHAQLKLCAALCPEMPGLHDASSTVVRSGAEVTRLTETGTTPKATELYSIDAVVDSTGEVCWLHTHGLQRGGLPDVEVLRVPRDRYRAAGSLIRYFVDQNLGDELPAQGEPFDLGVELQVAWKPLEEILEVHPAGVLGGAPDRDDHQHRGRRAVLVAPETRDPPLDAMARLDSGEAVSYVSRSEASRRASLARERWVQFGMMFATHRRDEASAGWGFLVKLGYPVDDQPEAREHLWFELLDIVPDRLRARLLSEPLGIATMEAGEEDWHELERLSDWVIQSPAGEITPSTVELEY